MRPPHAHFSSLVGACWTPAARLAWFGGAEARVRTCGRCRFARPDGRWSWERGRGSELALERRLDLRGVLLVRRASHARFEGLRRQARYLAVACIAREASNRRGEPVGDRGGLRLSS